MFLKVQCVITILCYKFVINFNDIHYRLGKQANLMLKHSGIPFKSKMGISIFLSCFALYSHIANSQVYFSSRFNPYFYVLWQYFEIKKVCFCESQILYFSLFLAQLYPICLVIYQWYYPGRTHAKIQTGMFILFFGLWLNAIFLCWKVFEVFGSIL